MWTYTAHRVVQADAATVEAALLAVVDRSWGRRARLVASSTTAGRVHAIADEHDPTDPDVWLTWQLDGVGPATRVTLVLDEVEEGPDPTDGLQQLLDLVERQVRASQSA